MARVFISHSSRDAAAAAELFAWLKGEGFEEGFLDIDKHQGIAPGQRWERRLYEELERAQAVVLLLTENWFASKWCFAEFAQARSRGKPVFPVVVSPAGDQFVGDDLQKLDLTADREGGLARLSRSLAEVALTGQGGFDLPPGRVPYPGFLAFDEEDAAIYFGRDDDVRRLIQRLDSRRIEGGRRMVLVLGESGTGKSSLLRAGILPRLRKAKRDWIVLAAFRPEDDPFAGLARSLRAAGIAADPATLPEADPGALAAALADRHGAHHAAVLVAVDQAEELFTRTPPERRAAFLAFLARLAGPGLPFVACLTLRSDQLGEWQRAAGPAADYEELSLKPMPLERIGDIVRGPARVAGIAVEEELIARIAADARTADALPLVAYALRQLHDAQRPEGEAGAGGRIRLRLADYEALRDAAAGLSPLETIVRQSADAALKALRPTGAELKALREAFVPALVKVNDEGGFVRQAAAWDDLPEAARRLLAALAGQQTRLLVLRERDGRREVEVAHEALFRVWPLLSGWLEEEKEFLTGRNRLEKALADRRALAGRPAEEEAKALLSGLLLDRSRAWLIEHPGRFSAEEAAFIRASDEADRARREAEEGQRRALEAARLRQAETERDAARRLTRRTRWAAVVLALVALAAAGAGWQALRSEQRATAEAERANQEAAEAIAATARAEAEAARASEATARAESEAVRASEAAAEATANLAAAERHRLEAIRNESVSLASLSSVALDQERPADAVQLALAAWPRPGAPDRPQLRRTVESLAAAISELHERLHLGGHAGPVVRAVFSADGKLAATASADGTARLWDAADGTLLHALAGHDGPVNDVDIAPDAGTLVTAGADGAAILWGADGSLRARLADAGGGLARFSADGSRILTLGADRPPRLWSAGGEPVATLVHAGLVRSAVFSADGSRVLTAAGDTVRVFDAATGTLLLAIPHPLQEVTSAAFSPDGSRIVATYRQDRTRIWSAATGEELVVVADDGAESVVFSPDGSELMLRRRGRAQFWDAATGRQIDGGDRALLAWNAVSAYSPDGRFFLVAKDDGEITLARTADGKRVAQLQGLAAAPAGVVFSADGQRVLTAGPDGTARVWALPSIGDPLRLSTGEVREIRFLPDSVRIFTFATDDQAAQLWDLAHPSAPLRLRTGSEAVQAAAVSPDGRLLAAVTRQRLRIWDAADGTPVREIGFRWFVPVMRFSPDGRALAVPHENAVTLFDSRTLRPVLELKGHADRVETIAFSADGMRLVTGDADGSVRLWDSVTGSPERSWQRDAAVLASYFGAGRTVVSAWSDGTVAVWDIAADAERRRFAVGRPIRTAVLSPDGRRLFVTDHEFDGELWDVASGARVQTVKSVFDVAFSADGAQLVTVGAPSRLRLHDAETGAVLATVEATGILRAPALAPDGRFAAAASEGAVFVWDISMVDAGPLLEVACTRLGNITDLAGVTARYSLGDLAPICGDAPPAPLDLGALE